MQNRHKTICIYNEHFEAVWAHETITRAISHTQVVSCDDSGGSRGVSLVSTETPFEK